MVLKPCFFIGKLISLRDLVVPWVENQALIFSGLWKLWLPGALRGSQVLPAMWEDTLRAL